MNPLCDEHTDVPQPDYIQRLPIEILQMILGYFVPEDSGPADWLSFLQWNERSKMETLVRALKVNKMFHQACWDLLSRQTTFNIEVSRSGVNMCRRNLQEPVPINGPPRHSGYGNSARDVVFQDHFPFHRLQRLHLDINFRTIDVHTRFGPSRADQVELYDRIDSIRALIPFLKRALNLQRLEVKVFINFPGWTKEQSFRAARAIINPLLVLRNIKHPVLHPISRDTDSHIPVPTNVYCREIGSDFEDFVTYSAIWERALSSGAPVPEPRPLIAKCNEFKAFYLQIEPYITPPTGSMHYLHRARVAREANDAQAFKKVQKDLVELWRQTMMERKRLDLIVKEYADTVEG